jgi:alpha-glucosidase
MQVSAMTCRGCRSIRSIDRATSNLRKDSTSILSLYARLLSLRRNHLALNSGALLLVSIQGNVLVFERTAGDQRILVCLNFGDTTQPISEEALSGSTILLSTYLDRSGCLDDLVLRPNEGLTILMKEKS